MSSVDDNNNKSPRNRKSKKSKKGKENGKQGSNKLFEEVFDTHAPLGAYFVTNTVDSPDADASTLPKTVCQVFSIWEKGQMHRHFKVRQGTLSLFNTNGHARARIISLEPFLIRFIYIA